MSIAVDEAIIQQRPAWLTEIVAILGEPRVKAETPQRMSLGREEGGFYRRCWVWFPDLKNHNIHIDQYSRFWEVGVACHCHHKDVTVRSKTEPTDDEMRALMRLADWPATAQPGGDS
jgi:hypothetical protein